MANEGKQVSPTVSTEGVTTLQEWQVVDVTRPLCSVGEECDKNQLAIFSKTGGFFFNWATGDTRYFTRGADGVYETEMWVPTPEMAQSLGFPRQGM